MPQKYIIYRTGEGDRFMTVIEGQPYYRSTGKNSGHPDIWFPFIKINDNLTLDYNVLASDNYNVANLANIDQRKKPSYIVKFERAFLQKKSYPGLIKTKDAYFDRLPTKITRITACRLTGNRMPLGDASFTAEELKLADAKIELELKPENIFTVTATNIKKVNNWLCDQGAVSVRKLLEPLRYSEEKSDAPLELPKSGSSSFFFCCRCTKEENNITSTPGSAPSYQLMK